MSDRDALKGELDRLVGDGREPQASAQRRIDAIRAQLDELDGQEGFERVRDLHRAHMARGVEAGFAEDERGAPWRP